MDAYGNIKIMDYGVSRALHAMKEHDPSTASRFVGTEMYMAPEVRNGQPCDQTSLDVSCEVAHDRPLSRIIVIL